MTERTSITPKNVAVTRVFDAPVEEVWKEWVEPERVMRWWGPAGFTAPRASMDFRVGGTSLVCMRASEAYGGRDMYNTWTYSKIEPYRQIEFYLRFSDENGAPLDPAALNLPPGVPDTVRNLVTFQDLGDGRTEMTVTEFGYTSDEAHDLSKLGLEQCLDKMAASLNSR